MSNQRVLFVEKNGNVLDKIRAKASRASPDWDVVTVNHLDAAAQLIAQRQFDLVIANFGADIAEHKKLFLELRNHSPATIRLGLSSTQNEGCLNSLEFSHGCLAVTADQGQVMAAIARGLGMSKKLRNNPKLSSLIAKLHMLPTPPAIYFAIREVLDSSTRGVPKVVDSIERDPALTARILKVANSGFYAMPRSVASLHQAVTLIGLDTVLSLVLAAHLFNQLPLPGLNLDKLWIHSITVSTLAKEIAADDGGDRQVVETSGVAGLLHDIGGLILLANAPQQYFPLVRQSRGDEVALHRLECEHFGVGHPELGSFVLGLWGLPDSVVEAVALHHCLSDGVARSASLQSKAVFAAEWLINTCPESAGAEIVPQEMREARLAEPDCVKACRTVFDRFMERDYSH